MHGESRLPAELGCPTRLGELNKRNLSYFNKMQILDGRKTLDQYISIEGEDVRSFYRKILRT